MVTESTRKPKKRGVTIRTSYGPAVMTEADVRAVEDLLVRLAVRRCVRENPFMFGADVETGDTTVVSGPPAAAAAVPSAPLGSAGGPEEMGLEHHDANGNIGDRE